MGGEEWITDNHGPEPSFEGEERKQRDRRACIHLLDFLVRKAMGSHYILNKNLCLCEFVLCICGSCVSA